MNMMNNFLSEEAVWVSISEFVDSNGKSMICHGKSHSWIGKNNLLVTPEYGSVLCLGIVLTNAPMDYILHESLLPECGNCNICSSGCEKQVLSGKIWNSTPVKRGNYRCV